MAGRGRGRGRGMSFSVETLGFGRGEALPGPILQPPPVFQPLEFKPVPLCAGKEYDYLLALKQEYRGAMKESAYFIKPPEKKRDIQRYSDKYQLGQQDGNNSHQPDWSRVPSELKLKTRKKVRIAPVIKPKLLVKVSQLKEEEITKTLAELAKKEDVDEQNEEADAEEEKDEDAVDGEDEEYYEDEDMEEETDYNLTYFDNGEEGLDEEDDLDEGPIY